MLDAKTVEKVAKLARLKISEVELADYAKVLSAVLDNFEQIADVDTNGVKPLLTPTDLPQHLRADEVKTGGDPEKILENAPEKSGRLFKVPPVV